ncbi:MAG TPA: VOC family protein [Sphingomicrobium sp.]|nr:VOC family protein [Sphingomicrobium sp.]
MLSEPEIGVGHIALTVSDVAKSTRFYSALGLQLCHEGGGIAILELRGGTHLLLFSRETRAAIPAVERIDLMIGARTKGELEAYRRGLLAVGLEAAPIPDEEFYGHYMLSLRDPDGNDVVVATSHCAPSKS